MKKSLLFTFMAMTSVFCIAKQEELQSPNRDFLKVENEDSKFMWMGGKTASVTAEYSDGKKETTVINPGKEAIFTGKPVRLHIGTPGKDDLLVLEKELKSGMEYDIKHGDAGWYLDEVEVAD